MWQKGINQLIRNVKGRNKVITGFWKRAAFRSDVVRVIMDHTLEGNKANSNTPCPFFSSSSSSSSRLYSPSALKSDCGVCTSRLAELVKGGLNPPRRPFSLHPLHRRPLPSHLRIPSLSRRHPPTAAPASCSDILHGDEELDDLSDSSTSALDDLLDDLNDSSDLAV
ncbi:hypothetical protein LXL04_009457 [Taraxacum kok-saghyz]